MLTRCLMFLCEALEERGLCPAPLTLVLTCSSPLLARLEVVNALPAKLFPKDRAVLLQAIMQRAEAMRARPFAFIMRELKPIIIFDTFPRPLGRIFGVVIIIAKARGAIGIHIL